MSHNKTDGMRFVVAVLATSVVTALISPPRPFTSCGRRTTQGRLGVIVRGVENDEGTNGGGDEQQTVTF